MSTEWIDDLITEVRTLIAEAAHEQTYGSYPNLDFSDDEEVRGVFLYELGIITSFVTHDLVNDITGTLFGYLPDDVPDDEYDEDVIG